MADFLSGEIDVLLNVKLGDEAFLQKLREADALLDDVEGNHQIKIDANNVGKVQSLLKNVQGNFNNLDDKTKAVFTNIQQAVDNFKAINKETKSLGTNLNTKNLETLAQKYNGLLGTSSDGKSQLLLGTSDTTKSANAEKNAKEQANLIGNAVAEAEQETNANVLPLNAGNKQNNTTGTNNTNKQNSNFIGPPTLADFQNRQINENLDEISKNTQDTVNQIEQQQQESKPKTKTEKEEALGNNESRASDNLRSILSEGTATGLGNKQQKEEPTYYDSRKNLDESLTNQIRQDLTNSFQRAIQKSGDVWTEQGKLKPNYSDNLVKQMKAVQKLANDNPTNQSLQDFMNEKLIYQKNRRGEWESLSINERLKKTNPLTDQSYLNASQKKIIDNYNKQNLSDEQVLSYAEQVDKGAKAVQRGIKAESERIEAEQAYTKTVNRQNQVAEDLDKYNQPIEQLRRMGSQPIEQFENQTNKKYWGGQKTDLSTPIENFQKVQEQASKLGKTASEFIQSSRDTFYKNLVTDDKGNKYSNGLEWITKAADAVKLGRAVSIYDENRNGGAGGYIPSRENPYIEKFNKGVVKPVDQFLADERRSYALNALKTIGKNLEYVDEFGSTLKNSIVDNEGNYFKNSASNDFIKKQASDFGLSAKEYLDKAKDGYFFTNDNAQTAVNAFDKAAKDLHIAQEAAKQSISPTEYLNKTAKEWADVVQEQKSAFAQKNYDEYIKKSAADVIAEKDAQIKASQTKAQSMSNQNMIKSQYEAGFQLQEDRAVYKTNKEYQAKQAQQQEQVQKNIDDYQEYIRQSAQQVQAQNKLYEEQRKAETERIVQQNLRNQQYAEQEYLRNKQEEKIYRAQEDDFRAYQKNKNSGTSIIPRSTTAQEEAINSFLGSVQKTELKGAKVNADYVTQDYIRSILDPIVKNTGLKLGKVGVSQSGQGYFDVLTESGEQARITVGNLNEELMSIKRTAGLNASGKGTLTSDTGLVRNNMLTEAVTSELGEKNLLSYADRISQINKNYVTANKSLEKFNSLSKEQQDKLLSYDKDYAKNLATEAQLAQQELETLGRQQQGLKPLTDLIRSSQYQRDYWNKQNLGMSDVDQKLLSAQYKSYSDIVKNLESGFQSLFTSNGEYRTQKINELKNEYEKKTALLQSGTVQGDKVAQYQKEASAAYAQLEKLNNEEIAYKKQNGEVIASLNDENNKYSQVLKEGNVSFKKLLKEQLTTGENAEKYNDLQIKSVKDGTAQIRYKDKEGNTVNSTIKADPQLKNDTSSYVNLRESGITTTFQTAKQDIGNWATNFKNQFSSIARMYSSMMLIQKGMQSFQKGLQFVKDFDESLTNIGMTMSATPQELFNVGQAAINTGKALGTSAENVMSAMAIYANANETGESIAQKAQATVMLANASGASTATAADQIQGVVQQFKGFEGQENSIINTYEKISANLPLDFATGINTMSEAVSLSGSVADEAGISFEQLASIAGVVASKTRQSGSTIGNLFKTTMARISRSKTADLEVTGKDRSNAAAAYESVGISLFNEKGEFNNLADTLDTLAGKWSNLTDVEQNYIAEQSAGTRGINVFRTMMENWGEIQDNVRDAMTDTNFFEEVQQKYSDSVKGATGRLSASVEGFWNSVINPSIIKDVTNFGATAVDTLTGMTEGINNAFALVTGQERTNVGSTLASVLTMGTTLLGGSSLMQTISNLKHVGKFGEWLDKENGVANATLAATGVEGRYTLGKAFSQGFAPMAYGWGVLKKGFNSIVGKYANLPNGAARRLMEYGDVSETMATNIAGTTGSHYLRLGQLGLFNKESFKGIKGLAEAFKEGNKLAQNKGLKEAFGEITQKRDIVDDAINSIKNGSLIGKELKKAQTIARGAAVSADDAIEVGVASSELGLTGTQSFIAKASALLTKAAPILAVAGTAAAIYKGVEHLNSANSEYQERMSEIRQTNKETAAELRDNESFLKTNKDLYNQLSQGVNTLNNANISLGTEEYQAYLNLVDEIATRMPSMVSGYDSLGHAILNSSNAMEGFNNNLKLEKTSNALDILDDMEEARKAFRFSYDSGYRGDDDWLRAGSSFSNEMKKTGMSALLTRNQYGDAVTLEDYEKMAEKAKQGTSGSDYEHYKAAKKLSEKMRSDMSLTWDEIAKDFTDQQRKYLEDTYDLGSLNINKQTGDILEGNELAKSKLDVLNQLDQARADYENQYLDSLGVLKDGMQAQLDVMQNSGIYNVNNLKDSDFNNISSLLSKVNYDQMTALQTGIGDEIGFVKNMVNALQGDTTGTLSEALNRVANINQRSTFSDIKEAYEKDIPLLANSIEGLTKEDWALGFGFEDAQETIDNAKTFTKELSKSKKLSEGISKDTKNTAKSIFDTGENLEFTDSKLNGFFDKYGLNTAEEFAHATELLRKEGQKFNTLDEFGSAYNAVSFNVEKMQENVDLLASYNEHIRDSFEGIFSAFGGSAGVTGLQIDKSSKGSFTNLLNSTFGGLKDYESDSLYYSSALGVKLDTKQYEKYLQEFIDDSKQIYQDTLTDAQQQLSDIDKRIANTTDRSELLTLTQNRDTLRNQIGDIKEQIGTFDGLTNSLSRFEQTMSNTSFNDTYKNYADLIGATTNSKGEVSYGSIQQIYKEGRFGNASFRAYVDAMSSRKLAGASASEIKAEYESLLPTLDKLFSYSDTDPSAGARNFFNMLRDFGTGDSMENFKLNADATVEGIRNMVEASTGARVSAEAIELLLENLTEYGVDTSNLYKSDIFKQMASDAKGAKDSLTQLGVANDRLDKINLNTDNVKDLKQSLDTVNQLIDEAGDNKELLKPLSQIKDFIQTQIGENIEVGFKFETTKGLSDLEDARQKIQELDQNLELNIDWSSNQKDEITSLKNQVKQSYENEKNKGTFNKDIEALNSYYDMILALKGKESQLDRRGIMAQDLTQIDTSTEAGEKLQNVTKSLQNIGALIEETNDRKALNDFMGLGEGSEQVQEYQTRLESLKSAIKSFINEYPDVASKIAEKHGLNSVEELKNLDDQTLIKDFEETVHLNYDQSGLGDLKLEDKEQKVIVRYEKSGEVNALDTVDNLAEKLGEKRLASQKALEKEINNSHKGEQGWQDFKIQDFIDADSEKRLDMLSKLSTDEIRSLLISVGADTAEAEQALEALLDGYESRSLNIPVEYQEIGRAASTELTDKDVEALDKLRSATENINLDNLKSQLGELGNNLGSPETLYEWIEAIGNLDDINAQRQVLDALEIKTPEIQDEIIDLAVKIHLTSEYVNGSDTVEQTRQDIQDMFGGLDEEQQKTVSKTVDLDVEGLEEALSSLENFESFWSSLSEEQQKNFLLSFPTIDDSNIQQYIEQLNQAIEKKREAEQELGNLNVNPSSLDTIDNNREKPKSEKTSSSQSSSGNTDGSSFSTNSNDVKQAGKDWGTFGKKAKEQFGEIGDFFGDLGASIGDYFQNLVTYTQAAGDEDYIAGFEQGKEKIQEFQSQWQQFQSEVEGNQIQFPIDDSSLNQAISESSNFMDMWNSLDTREQKEAVLRAKGETGDVETLINQIDTLCQQDHEIKVKATVEETGLEEDLLSQYSNEELEILVNFKKGAEDFDLTSLTDEQVDILVNLLKGNDEVDMSSFTDEQKNIIINYIKGTDLPDEVKETLIQTVNQEYGDKVTDTEVPPATQEVNQEIVNDVENETAQGTIQLTPEISDVGELDKEATVHYKADTSGISLGDLDKDATVHYRAEGPDDAGEGPTRNGTVYYTNDDSAIPATGPDRTGTVYYTHDDSAIPSTGPRRSGTVYYTADTSGISTEGPTKYGKVIYSESGGGSGDGKVQGTAHHNGTALAEGSKESPRKKSLFSRLFRRGETEGEANAKGNWGLGSNLTSLVGELGQELVVRGSKWFTVGDNGAEFTKLQKGDIVFNHKQTEEILKNGKIGSRGKALKNGTAFATGGVKNTNGAGQYTGTWYRNLLDRNRVIDQTIKENWDKGIDKILEELSKIPPYTFDNIDKLNQQLDDSISEATDNITSATEELTWEPDSKPMDIDQYFQELNNIVKEELESMPSWINSSMDNMPTWMNMEDIFSWTKDDPLDVTDLLDEFNRNVLKHFQAYYGENFKLTDSLQGMVDANQNLLDQFSNWGISYNPIENLERFIQEFSDREAYRHSEHVENGDHDNLYSADVLNKLDNENSVKTSGIELIRKYINNMTRNLPTAIEESLLDTIPDTLSEGIQDGFASSEITAELPQGTGIDDSKDTFTPVESHLSTINDSPYLGSGIFQSDLNSWGHTSFGNASEVEQALKEAADSLNGTSDNLSNAAQDLSDAAANIDWAERFEKQLKHVLDRFDAVIENDFLLYTTRKLARSNEFTEITKQLTTYQSIYQYYMNEANKIGLSGSIVSQIQSGTLNATTITDEGLKQQVDDYIKYYDASQDAQGRMVELAQKQREMVSTQFDARLHEYEQWMQGIANSIEILDNKMKLVETKGHFIGDEYWKTAIASSDQQVRAAEDAWERATRAFDVAANSGILERSSEQYRDMALAVQEVALQWYEAKEAFYQYQQQIYEARNTLFDYKQDLLGDIHKENEFLRGLIGLQEDDLFSTRIGRMNAFGYAVGALHAEDYELYMQQAQDIREEIKHINDELEDDPFNDGMINKDLLDRRRELVESYQEMIESANGEKMAIRDLVEEQYNRMLDCIQKIIDKRKEQLRAEKELYDYERNVSDQVRNITDLYKQLNALQLDDSEEAKVRKQKLKDQIEKAEKDLESTEYDRWVSDQETLMDKFYTEAEEVFKAELRKVDQHLQDMIDYANNNLEKMTHLIDMDGESGRVIQEAILDGRNTVSQIIHEYSDKFGYELQSGNDYLWHYQGKILNELPDILYGGFSSVVDAIDKMNEWVTETLVQNSISAMAPLKNHKPLDEATIKPEVEVEIGEVETENWFDSRWGSGNSLWKEEDLEAAYSDGYFGVNPSDKKKTSLQNYKFSLDGVEVEGAVDLTSVKKTVDQILEQYYRKVQYPEKSPVENVNVSIPDTLSVKTATLTFENMKNDYQELLMNQLVDNTGSIKTTLTNNLGSITPAQTDLNQELSVTFNLPNVTDSQDFIANLRRNREFLEIVSDTAANAISGNSLRNVGLKSSGKR